MTLAQPSRSAGKQVAVAITLSAQIQRDRPAENSNYFSVTWLHADLCQQTPTDMASATYSTRYECDI